MHPSEERAVALQDIHILVVDDVEQNLVAIATPSDHRAADAEAFVAARIAEGSDHIKVFQQARTTGIDVLPVVAGADAPAFDRFKVTHRLGRDVGPGGLAADVNLIRLTRPVCLAPEDSRPRA